MQDSRFQSLIQSAANNMEENNSSEHARPPLLSHRQAKKKKKYICRTFLPQIRNWGRPAKTLETLSCSNAELANSLAMALHTPKLHPCSTTAYNELSINKTERWHITITNLQDVVAFSWLADAWRWRLDMKIQYCSQIQHSMHLPWLDHRDKWVQKLENISWI